MDDLDLDKYLDDNNNGNSVTYRIKEFNPENIAPSTNKSGIDTQGGSKTVIIGKAGTGKSTIITSLLYAKKHIFPTGIVMSGSESSNHYYSQFFPELFVYNEYDEEVVKSVVKRQKIAKEHLQNPWSVLLIDDCADDPKIFKKPLQQNLFKVGRHYKLWYILSLQYAVDIPPAVRVNVDNVFILREPSVKIRKIIWENYASIIPDFSTFCRIMDGLSDNYTAMVINNQTASNKIEDCVFYYKSPHPDTFKRFKFGCIDYRKFANARHNTDYVENLFD